MMDKPKTMRELFEESLTIKNINLRPFATPGAPAQEKYNNSYQWEIHGAVTGPYIQPLEYTTWWEESLALRNTAMLGDWSHLEKFRLKGPDAQMFVSYLTTKDLTKQDVDHVYFTPMVDKEGKVAMEGLLFRLAENEYLFTDGPPIQWFKYVRELTKMDVEIEYVTPDYSIYQLQGPRSFDILEMMTGENFHDLPFSRSRWLNFKGFDVYVSRQGVTGELGFELMTPVDGDKANNAVVVWDSIAEVGANYGLRMIGTRARRIGHVEAGIPTRRYEYTRAIPSGYAVDDYFDKKKFVSTAVVKGPGEPSQYATPGELGWEHVVNLNKPDFLGREALIKEREAGEPSRNMMGLIWSSDDVANLFAGLFRDELTPWPPIWPQNRMPVWLRVLNDGEFVGWAMSPTYSPNLRRMISFGRVNKEMAEAGNEVIVEYCDPTGMIRNIRANITKLPFIPHKRNKDMSKEKSILNLH